MSGTTGFTVFNVQTGEIVSVGECVTDQHELQAQGPSLRAIPTRIDPATQYIDTRTNAVMTRQPMNVRQENARLTGLPIPCKLRIEGDEYTVGDGDADLDFDQPGRYVVEITAPQYLTQTITIDIP